MTDWLGLVNEEKGEGKRGRRDKKKEGRGEYGERRNLMRKVTKERRIRSKGRCME